MADLSTQHSSHAELDAASTAGHPSPRRSASTPRTPRTQLTLRMPQTPQTPQTPTETLSALTPPYTPSAPFLHRAVTVTAAALLTPPPSLRRRPSYEPCLRRAPAADTDGPACSLPRAPTPPLRLASCGGSDSGEEDAPQPLKYERQLDGAMAYIRTRKEVA